MRSVVSALWALVCVVGLQAHRAPEALTTIEFNSNTGLTEVVHRLHLHDLEPNLNRILKEKRQSLETLEGRARVAIYVQERFAIVPGGGNKPLNLTLLGAEIEGDSLYVYQEYKGELPSSLKIRNDILRDSFSNQINTVILKVASNLHSLKFSKDDKWKQLDVSSE